MINTEKTHPRFDFDIGFGICDIVDNNSGTCSFVIYFAECFVAFLAGCVPEGNFDLIAIDVNIFWHELNSECRLANFVEEVADEPGGDVGLSDSWSSNHNNFVCIMIILHGYYSLYN